MTIRTAQLSVGTTAVKVSGDDDARADQNVCLRAVGGSLFVGGADVTTTTGFEVPTGGTFDDTLQPGEVLYAIAASSVTVHVYRSGVA